MSYVPPRDPAELSTLAPMLDAVQAAMGFVPNSMLTMAHLPQLPVAFSLLANTVLGGDLDAQLDQLRPIVPPAGALEPLNPALVQLVALAVSTAAGCRYCQAHTSHGAHLRGVDEAKIADLLRYESSPLFSEAERAAMALAFAAGKVPNETEAGHFTALREHFSESQVVQLVAVIALFGFLNRWNDTLATAIETQPRDFAVENLNGLGWTAGKHAATEQPG